MGGEVRRWLGRESPLVTAEQFGARCGGVRPTPPAPVPSPTVTASTGVAS